MSTTSAQTLDFTLGRKLTEITLGIDALERSISKGEGALDTEGLVPIYLGKDIVTGAVFADWQAALEALDSLESSITPIPSKTRKTFLLGMVRSLRAAVRLFSGEHLSYQEKLTDLVGVPAQPVPDEAIDALHDELDVLMRHLGYTTGTLGERVHTWQTGRYLEPAAIPAVFEELMAEAQRRTDAMIWPTGDYTMRLNAVRNVPYAGRCSFEEGNMDINLDVRVTRAAMKHLVAHEVFPGHSTQLLSTRAVVERGEASPDALLCTVNAVTGAMQEGIGDQGIDLIDWVEDENDAAQIGVRRLQTAAGTNAAWHLHVSGWSKAQSIAYLCEVGFAQESWSKVRTGMALHPFRGPFLASYWFGNETVKSLRERAAGKREHLLDQLYRHVHSIESLQMALV